MSLPVSASPPPSASPPTSGAAPPGASGAAPPGAPPSGTPFEGALAEQLARTAPAEGQQQNHSEDQLAPVHTPSRRGAHTRRTAEAPAAQPSGATATAGAADLQPQTRLQAQMSAATQLPGATAPDAAATTLAQAPLVESARAGAAATLLSDSSTPEKPIGAPSAGEGEAAAAAPHNTSVGASPTDSASGPLAPGVDQGPQPATPLPSGAAQTSAPAAAPQQAPAPAGAPASGSAIDKSAASADSSPESSTLRLAAPAAATPPTLRAAEPASNPAGGAIAGVERGATATQSSDAASAPPGAASASATGSLPALSSPLSGEATGEQPRQHEGGARESARASLAGATRSGGAISSTQGAEAAQPGEVPLSALPPSAGEASSASQLPAGFQMQEMIDSIHATIELAARQGITQARIALEPEQLGSVRIHLSQTADGLLARVTAETPAAAQALASGRAELHHSLSSLGVSLLRLDISSYGHSQARERGSGFMGGPGRRSGALAGAGVGEDAENSQTAGQLAATTPTVGLANGGLVDVLA